ncbi:hypothetical protein ABZ766_21160 [Streptomyces sp. NPDC006670]|uniref:hypothetical protein n=1 Tax=Streptomyces sp. NPDC006670 TaxID=3154476 RepID=UPI0033E66038
MRKSLVATLAAAAVAVLLTGPATPASASVSCFGAGGNTSILFYRAGSGSAETGTLSAGHWESNGAFHLPRGYTHAAASHDSLLLYNKITGAGEVGTFTGGEYARTRTYGDLPTGWTQVEASGDSVIFYNARTGHAVTGTLRDGKYQQVRTYDHFKQGWVAMAASCDTLTAEARPGSATFSWDASEYGTLEGGVYGHTGSLFLGEENHLGQLTATRDSLLSWAKAAGKLELRAGDATNGWISRFRGVGTTGPWEKVGRTADSLIFYDSDGTASASTLVDGDYKSVGPLDDVSPGWTLIEGGV